MEKRKISNTAFIRIRETVRVATQQEVAEAYNRGLRNGYREGFRDGKKHEWNLWYGMEET